MNNEQTSRFILQGLLPRGRSAILLLVIVAIVAFSLGGLLFSGGSDQAANGDSHGHSGDAASNEPTMWTCSMHPQIQLPKAGKCPICFMDLIPVETSSGSELEPRQIRMSENAVQLAGIQTTTVMRAYAERAIRMVGKLNYDETRVATIAAWVPGRLDSLFVDFTGATVRKGDRMVQMYSPELVAAQEELQQAAKAVNNLSGSSSSVLQSTAKQTLTSARDKLRLYGLSDDQISAIEAGSEPSEHLTITAPASGVVVHKDAKEGMYVATGTRIYTIANLNRLWVQLEAYESDLPWLRIGQQLSFTTPSFPGETFDAEISFIDPVVDPKTRTVDIRAIVENDRQRLKPEMFVSATVESRLDSDGNIVSSEMVNRKVDDNAPLLIPATAPLITGKRAVVYLQLPSDEGIVFEGREITLGPRAGDAYVVKSGLEEGERIVTNGAFRLDSELQIQAKPSMMSPKGGAMTATHDHGDRDAGPITVTANAKTVYEAGSADRHDVSDDALAALTPVYDAYFDVQMALANDDLESATSAYAKLAETIKQVPMSKFTGDGHMRWMAISKELTDAAQTGASVGSIVSARDAFFKLSQAAIELHDTFGHAADIPFYLTYCPMARDNAGAYWLQEENIVWNSFYGDMMLRCGEIKQELKAGNAAAE